MFNKNRDRKLFETICKGADKLDLEYKSVAEKNLIAFGIKGDDLPMSVVVNVDEGNNTIIFAVKLMFEVPEDQVLNVICALNRINTDIRFGQFHFDEDQSAVFFRFGIPFEECKTTPDFVSCMMMMVVETVDSNDGDIKRLIDEGKWKKSGDAGIYH